VKYLSFDKTKRDALLASWTAWSEAYTAWGAETDATKKAALLPKVTETQAAFDKLVGDSSSSGGSTAIIVIGVVLVLAAAVGGALWYKKKQSADKEGGEADDRKLYKSQIASVNAHKKAQKVALVDADV